MAPDPRTLAAMYERGAITGTDLILGFADAAVDHPPETMASLVPNEWLDQLRGLASNPDRVRVVFAGSFVGGSDSVARDREQTPAYVAGLYRWREYFARLDAG